MFASGIRRIGFIFVMRPKIQAHFGEMLRLCIIAKVKEIRSISDLICPYLAFEKERDGNSVDLCMMGQMPEI
jgi:hypothetical protein